MVARLDAAVAKPAHRTRAAGRCQNEIPEPQAFDRNRPVRCADPRSLQKAGRLERHVALTDAAGVTGQRDHACLAERDDGVASARIGGGRASAPCVECRAEASEVEQEIRRRDAQQRDTSRIRRHDERVGVRREGHPIIASPGDERVVGVQGENGEPADGVGRRRTVDTHGVRRRIDRGGSRAAELQHQPRRAVADERVAEEGEVSANAAIERAGEETGGSDGADAQIEQQQVVAAELGISRECRTRR